MFNFKSIVNSVNNAFALKNDPELEQLKREVEATKQVGHLIDLYGEAYSFVESAGHKGYADLLDQESFRVHKLAFMANVVELDDKYLDVEQKRMVVNLADMLETASNIMAELSQR